MLVAAALYLGQIMGFIVSYPTLEIETKKQFWFHFIPGWWLFEICKEITDNYKQLK